MIWDWQFYSLYLYGYLNFYQFKVLNRNQSIKCIKFNSNKYIIYNFINKNKNENIFTFLPKVIGYNYYYIINNTYLLVCGNKSENAVNLN